MKGKIEHVWLVQYSFDPVSDSGMTDDKIIACFLDLGLAKDYARNYMLSEKEQNPNIYMEVEDNEGIFIDGFCRSVTVFKQIVTNQP